MYHSFNWCTQVSVESRDSVFSEMEDTRIPIETDGLIDCYIPINLHLFLTIVAHITIIIAGWCKSYYTERSIVPCSFTCATIFYLAMVR